MSRRIRLNRFVRFTPVRLENAGQLGAQEYQMCGSAGSGHGELCWGHGKRCRLGVQETVPRPVQGLCPSVRGEVRAAGRAVPVFRPSGHADCQFTVFANANLACEQQMGKMIAMKTGAEYESYRQGHLDYLRSVQKKIDKTVDLFCRIKSTDQAEEVATVFFSVRELKKDKPTITEQDVFDYILNWKKKWNTPEKKTAIADSIRNLVILRWIGAEFSMGLLSEDAV